METQCQHCGQTVEDPEADLFWEFPDWPAACRLVCQDCLPEECLECGNWIPIDGSCPTCSTNSLPS